GGGGEHPRRTREGGRRSAATATRRRATDEASPDLSLPFRARVGGYGGQYAIDVASHRTSRSLATRPRSGSEAVSAFAADGLDTLDWFVALGTCVQSRGVVVVAVRVVVVVGRRPPGVPVDHGKDDERHGGEQRRRRAEIEDE